jgi:hypothetical protein
MWKGMSTGWQGFCTRIILPQVAEAQSIFRSGERVGASVRSHGGWDASYPGSTVPVGRNNFGCPNLQLEAAGISMASLRQTRRPMGRDFSLQDLIATKILGRQPKLK